MDTNNCPVFDICGGCDFPLSSYEEELKEKNSYLSGLLGSFCKVKNIIPMEDPYGYRNKVHHALAKNKQGKIFSGIYSPGSHKVIPGNSCCLEDKDCLEIINTFTKLIGDFRIPIYNESDRTGLLRRLLVRKACGTGEIMAVAVSSSPVVPSRSNLVKALLKIHPEITTVILNINTQQNSMILGPRNIVLYGPGYIRDVLLDTSFRISCDSFYQINSVQTVTLYKTAMDLAGLSGKESVLDAYCGTGTIGLLAAPLSSRVTGIELNPSAVRDARINAKDNKISNAGFICGDAGDVMTSLYSEGKHFDLVFTDPPRSGCSEDFIRTVLRLKVPKVVYISCCPETLARDLIIFTKGGMRPVIIQPVDMFPHTKHVECVTLMTRK